MVFVLTKLLTIHIDVDLGSDRLGVVVVVPLALQGLAHVGSVESLQLHCVPALARADLFPAGDDQLCISKIDHWEVSIPGVKDNTITGPGHRGAWPTFKCECEK